MDQRKRWIDVEAVQQQISYAAAFTALTAEREYLEFAYGYLAGVVMPHLESPLEAIFRIWWEAHVFNQHEQSDTARLRLHTQREVVCGDQNYRLDFVVQLLSDTEAKRLQDIGSPFPLIAVEVDGHEFHEKTKEQVAYRNQRDRSLQQAGWIVFHFSWTELTKDGAKCVKEVLDHALTALYACDAAEYRQWIHEHPEAVERLNDALLASQSKTTV